MKKYVVAAIIVVFAFFAFQSFAQSADSGSLFSFRGVLFGILKEAENIAAHIASPFVGSKTAPAAEQKTADENSFSFAIIGDTQRFTAGNSNGNFQKVAAKIKAMDPALVFAVGDLVSSCDGDSKCSAKYADWKKIVGTLLPKTYAMQGNHDRTGDDKTDNTWRGSFTFPTNGPSGFSEQDYSFDYKNSHFVVLDSDKPKEHLVSGDQRAWLEKDLSAGKYENTFVFFHEPAYPTGAKISESLDIDPGERDALWQILGEHNVTAVFNGHEHIVSRRKVGSIYQFVFASTDSFDHDLPKPGIAEYSNQGQGRFGFVKVSGKEITVETHDSSGATLNSFTFSK